MMVMVDACLAVDPSALGSPEFVALRKGCRVIDGAVLAVQKIIASPPKEEFKAAHEEYRTIAAIVDPCVAMDPSCFSSPEFMALRKGSRVMEGALVAVRRILSSPPKNIFSEALSEYKDLMGIIEPCECSTQASRHLTIFSGFYFIHVYSCRDPWFLKQV